MQRTKEIPREPRYHNIIIIVVYRANVVGQSVIIRVISHVSYSRAYDTVGTHTVSGNIYLQTFVLYITSTKSSHKKRPDPREHHIKFLGPVFLPTAMIRRNGEKRKKFLKKRGEQSTLHHWNRYRTKEMKGVI